MQIALGELLAGLEEAKAGLTTGKETVEQSNCFCFDGGFVRTFNDEIAVTARTPLKITAAIEAATLQGLLKRVPDKKIDMAAVGGEIVIKGKGRAAGITAMAEVLLPYKEVPRPKAWHPMPEGVLANMRQAARVCAPETAQFLATCVHVTPNLIQGCDNFRLFRATGKTGFTEEMLIAARNVLTVAEMEITKVACTPGWCHFKCASGTRVSVRASSEAYHTDVDTLLEMERPEALTLPATLKEIVERADVCNTGGYDDRVAVSIGGGKLTLRARREGAWYAERKRVNYTGRALAFDINPKFLVEVLGRTRDVEVDANKLKITSGRTNFVVVLSTPEKPKAKVQKKRS